MYKEGARSADVEFAQNGRCVVESTRTLNYSFSGGKSTFLQPTQCDCTPDHVGT